MNADSQDLKSLSGEKSNDSTVGHPLILGFDGKRAAQNFTGLGNYSRYVLNILSVHHPDNVYNLYSPFPLAKKTQAISQLAKAVRICTPKSSYFKSVWRSWGVLSDLKKDGIEIYHGLSNEIPFGIKKINIASVVTIHDLIFLRYPEYYPWFDRIIYGLKFKYACRNADKIIAVSEQTKNDIVAYFNVDESKIEVIYQNCAPVFRSEISENDKESVNKKYSLPERYLLSVGTIERRKNLILIVKALRQIDENVSLVVVGKETAYVSEVKRFIDENKLTSRVMFLTNVPLNDLPAIYRQAEVFIFPSRFEGFGIPIVEALHCGVPVIAASGSCLEEAGGPGSLYINPDNETEMSDAINSILKNPTKRQTMANAGIAYVENFSDEKIAGKLINLYKQLVRQ